MYYNYIKSKYEKWDDFCKKFDEAISSDGHNMLKSAGFPEFKNISENAKIAKNQLDIFDQAGKNRTINLNDFITFENNAKKIYDNSKNAINKLNEFSITFNEQVKNDGNFKNKNEIVNMMNQIFYLIIILLKDEINFNQSLINYLEKQKSRIKGLEVIPENNTYVFNFESGFIKAK